MGYHWPPPRWWRGYAAAVDLLRALDALLRTGRVPEPVRRWTLGVPDHATRPPDRPRR